MFKSSCGFRYWGFSVSILSEFHLPESYFYGFISIQAGSILRTLRVILQTLQHSTLKWRFKNTIAYSHTCEYYYVLYFSMCVSVFVRLALNTFRLMPCYKCGIFRIWFCFCFFFLFIFNIIFLYTLLRSIDTEQLQFIHFFHFSGMDFSLASFVGTVVRSFILLACVIVYIWLFYFKSAV